MKNLLNCKVVMLPTEKADLFVHYGRDLCLNTSGEREKTNYVTPQHLYLISDREIKEGDWYYNPNPMLGDNYIKQRTKGGVEWVKKFPHAEKNHKKIEATTDTLIVGENKSDLGVLHTHRLYQIPKSFIEAYVKANGKINEIQIEMEEITGYDDDNYPLTSKGEIFNNQIKTRDDNTVIIHLNIEEKKYTREEVKEILNGSLNYLMDVSKGKISENGSILEWFNKNYPE